MHLMPIFSKKKLRRIIREEIERSTLSQNISAELGAKAFIGAKGIQEATSAGPRQ